MKIFKNKNIIVLIKLIIYVELLAVAYYLEWNVKFFTENINAFRAIQAVEIVLIGLIAWTVITLIRMNFKFLWKNAKKLFEKIIIKPIKKILQFKFKPKKKYMKGKDEKQFIFNFDLIEKFKTRRRKLDLKHSKSNMERIRLLYIKLILILTEKDKEVKYSYTPKEVKKNCSWIGNEILFETYEQVRYGELGVTDEVVQMCEKTME